MRSRCLSSCKALVVAGAIAGALAFQPSFAQPPSPRVISPAAEQRIQQARERGFWIVEEGDYLYRIARYFASDEEAVKALVAELRELNEHALMNGRTGSKLVVGARLHLPARLKAVPEAAPPAVAVGPAAVPPISPPVAA